VVNNSYLLGLFGGTSTFGGLGGAGVATPPRKTQPTAPWSPAAAASVPEPSDLVRNALNGRRFIDESAAKLDLGGASADYRKMFALYQGLSTLGALADRAQARGVPASEQARLATRFAQGMEEISGYLAAARFDDVHLVQGTTATTAKTTAAVARDSTRVVTAALHEGSLADPVEAFEGQTAFDITVTSLVGPKTVSIDLNDMGATPRTFDAVVAHINGRLLDAGVQTRFQRTEIAGEPRKLEVGGRTIDLPALANSWALGINGVSTETVSFSAAASADAVYVVQGQGTGGDQQLLKFQDDADGAPAPTGPRVGETRWVEGRLSQTDLPTGIETVRASATGADGSLWVVADLDGQIGDQPIKGERDVALMKFDSSGRLLLTQTLGAASNASGYAIDIAADGRVAVAGSVTGGLDAGQPGVDGVTADSFVTVYGADGVEQWTQRRGAKAADEATGVRFGPDGKVYVTGRSQSAMPGNAARGGWDAYVQVFDASQAYPGAKIVSTGGVAQSFGTVGDDRVDAMTVDGTDLYTAGIENRRAVVRRFTLDATGQPTLVSTRDLGPMDGSIADIAVSDGRVVLVGQSSGGTLAIDPPTVAHSGGKDAFVATLDRDLTASAQDSLSYFGSARDDTVADARIHNGKVWLTGTYDRDPLAKLEEGLVQGYLARLDPLTGATEYRQTWTGEDTRAMPTTLAVATGGASVLDRLGLPKGEVVYPSSETLIDATALRVGDRFSIAPPGGGRVQTVTIAATDTLQTLARKIELASGRTLKVTITPEAAPVAGKIEANGLLSGLQRLSIAANSARDGAVLVAGEPGRDALAGLGLSPGLIGPAPGKGDPKAFGLNLSRTLSLGPDAETAKAAKGQIDAAMKAIRDAYRSLSPQTTPVITGEAPAYLTAQLANYQAALSRLTA